MGNENVTKCDMPADMKDMEHIDTIILDGKIAYVEYHVWNDTADSFIGIQHLYSIPTFKGEQLTATDEFAFSPKMEEKLGWGKIYASLSYALSDSPIDPHSVAESAILSYYGLIDRKYTVSWSDMSGYLWTDEEFKVGGHSILDILTENRGRYIHMEMSLYRKRLARR